MDLGPSPNESQRVPTSPNEPQNCANGLVGVALLRFGPESQRVPTSPNESQRVPTSPNEPRNSANGVVGIAILGFGIVVVVIVVVLLVVVSGGMDTMGLEFQFKLKEKTLPCLIQTGKGFSLSLKTSEKVKKRTCKARRRPKA